MKKPLKLSGKMITIPLKNGMLDNEGDGDEPISSSDKREVEEVVRMIENRFATMTNAQINEVKKLIGYDRTRI